jgi:hypothetical protein
VINHYLDLSREDGDENSRPSDLITGETKSPFPVKFLYIYISHTAKSWYRSIFTLFGNRSARPDQTLPFRLAGGSNISYSERIFRCPAGPIIDGDSSTEVTAPEMEKVEKPTYRG